MNFTQTAVRSALRPFRKRLSLVDRALVPVKGRAVATDVAPVYFQGAIVPAGTWRRAFVPGGVGSVTSPLLVVSSTLLSEGGQALAITAKDVVVTAGGVRYQVDEQMNEADQFGIHVYTLSESRT